MNDVGDPFDTAVAARDRGIAVDLGAPGGPLLVAFGGWGGAMAMPPFEFFRVTSSLSVNRLFVRDLQQCWYHRGVPELGRDIDEVAASIGAMIERERPSRVVVTGNSIGGYAALLFGCLLGADTVIAFSPRTYMGRVRRVAHLEVRGIVRHWRVYGRGVGDRRYFDLRRVIAARPPASEIDFHVHVSSTERVDMAHARHLAGLSNVRTHAYGFGGHALVRSLRDRGLLEPILRDALFP